MNLNSLTARAWLASDAGRAWTLARGGHNCGTADMTYDGGACDGWGYVTLDTCKAYCAANTVAPGCAKQHGSHVCGAITHYDQGDGRGHCHLYSTNMGCPVEHQQSNRYAMSYVLQRTLVCFAVFISSFSMWHSLFSR